MVKILVAFLLLLAAATGWLARPWSGPHDSLNASFRGNATSLPMSELCPAVSEDGRFAWGKITSDAALEACMVDVAKALVTPAEMADWLTAQGFAGPPPYETGAIPSSILVSVQWKDRENPARRPYGGALSRAGDRFLELMRAIPGLENSYLFRKRPYRLNVSYEADGTVKADAGMDYL
jgi:hypothetical protein